MSRKTLEEFFCEVYPMLRIGDVRLAHTSNHFDKTHTISGLPFISGDLIYSGQVMNLYGRIRDGEFNLQNIFFSPKEMDLLEDSFVFFYSDILHKIPVFVPIKKENKEINRSRMFGVLDFVFDTIIRAISEKRLDDSSMGVFCEYSLN